MSTVHFVLLPMDAEAAHAALVRRDTTAKHAARPLQPVTEWGKEVMHAVTKDQGFSLHDAIGDAPHTGYMVSLSKRNEAVIPLRDLTPGDIADYRDLHQQELADPANFLGGWVYKGKVYLDVSRHFTDLQQAMEGARDHDQIGVYDLGSGQTILTAEYFARQKAAASLSVQAKEMSDLDFVNLLRKAHGLTPLVHDTRGVVAKRALTLVSSTDGATKDS